MWFPTKYLAAARRTVELELALERERTKSEMKDALLELEVRAAKAEAEKAVAEVRAEKAEAVAEVRAEKAEAEVRAEKAVAEITALTYELKSRTASLAVLKGRLNMRGLLGESLYRPHLCVFDERLVLIRCWCWAKFRCRDA
jgi:uncharacterized membrane protein YqiK